MCIFQVLTNKLILDSWIDLQHAVILGDSNMCEALPIAGPEIGVLLKTFVIMVYEVLLYVIVSFC